MLQATVDYSKCSANIVSSSAGTSADSPLLRPNKRRVGLILTTNGESYMIGNSSVQSLEINVESGGNPVQFFRHSHGEFVTFAVWSPAGNPVSAIEIIDTHGDYDKAK